MAKPNFAKDQLKSIVERVERLEEEKTALSGDIREVYAEAKGSGFDTKVMRQIVRLRKMDSADRQEQVTRTTGWSASTRPVIPVGGGAKF